MQITETVTIDAPIDRVWALTTDLEALPSITPTVTGVDVLDDGPLHPGTRARLTQPGLPPRVWTVEDLDAPHRFAWATRLFGIRMAGIHELAPTATGGTLLTLRVVLEGRGAAILGRLGGRSIATSIAAEAAGFARAAERPEQRTTAS